MIESQINYIKKFTGDFVPKIAMILGSGWNEAISEMEIIYQIPFVDVPDMPKCSVLGHEGVFIFGYLSNVPVVIMKGRLHLYEGHTAEVITNPIRLFKGLGVETVILTNAAGGLKPTLKVGEVVIINDHINLTCHNPLIGIKPTTENPVFINMTDVYNSKYIEKTKKVCQDNSIDYSTGTYIQLLGPSFETPSEVKMLSLLGGTCVGMSTVQEAIMARYLKMEVIGLSFISNLGAGITGNKLNHQEVLENAKNNAIKLKTLLKELVKKI